MKTACPFCNSEFEVDESFENQETKCPSCGNDFIITPCEDKPKPTAEPVKDEPKPTAEPVKDEPKPTAEPVKPKKKQRCPICNKTISVFAETCPGCGHVLPDIPPVLIVMLWVAGFAVPFGMIFIVILTSVLYYLWKNKYPRNAAKINRCGWSIFVFSIFIYLVAFLFADIWVSSIKR